MLKMYNKTNISLGKIKTHTQKYTVISYNNILYYIPTLKYQSSIIVVICDSNFPIPVGI